jgi:hypothetical protein
MATMLARIEVSEPLDSIEAGLPNACITILGEQPHFFLLLYTTFHDEKQFNQFCF